MPVLRRARDRCGQCGAGVPPGARFCASCGYSFTTVSPVDVSGVVAPPPRRRHLRRWWPAYLVVAVVLTQVIGYGFILGAEALLTPVAAIPPPATSGPSVAQAKGATLGGPEGAFVDGLFRDGPYTAEAGVDHFARCPDFTDQYTVSFVSGRAATILRQFCNAAPAGTQRMAEARGFFPPDALASGSPYTDENGDKAWSFVSANLAAIFPASAFQVCQDGTPAGTFELDVTRTGWQVGLGRCP